MVNENMELPNKISQDDNAAQVPNQGTQNTRREKYTLAFSWLMELIVFLSGLLSLFTFYIPNQFRYNRLYVHKQRAMSLYS